MTLEQLQKRSMQEKEKHEGSQSQAVKLLEAKFKNQIRDIINTNQTLSNEYLAKIKRLEQDLLTVNEKYVSEETSGKIVNVGSLERQLLEV